jgi:16S rRNA (adenine1518-N6/adenine1519-N6)-dimethyltransferase
MTNLPPLRDVIEHFGLRAKKSLGQNFLLDLNLTAKIARTAGPLEGHTILEIGPGPGGLTRSLLAEGAEHVIAVERDDRCLEALQQISQAYPDRLTVVAADALSLDQEDIVRQHAKGLPVKIVANLPYNIGTPLLVDWLSRKEWPPFYKSLTLMFQKEVAERLVATPGSKAYGRLSVLTGWRSDAQLVFDLPPSAFTPAPKVTSTVVHITPKPAPIAQADLSVLEKVVASAFGQRRKMLRQSLKTFTGSPLPLLEAANIDPTRRAETLSIEEFCALAGAHQRP